MIVGKLDSKGFCPPNLVAIKCLEKTNHSMVARFVNQGMRDLIIKRNIILKNNRRLGHRWRKVLLLATDAAAYMKKAARALSVFYPNLIHVTRLCHGLYRLADNVRSNFPNVDSLISNTKKVI